LSVSVHGGACGLPGLELCTVEIDLGTGTERIFSPEAAQANNERKLPTGACGLPGLEPCKVEIDLGAGTENQYSPMLDRMVVP